MKHPPNESARAGEQRAVHKNMQNNTSNDTIKKPAESACAMTVLSTFDNPKKRLCKQFFLDSRGEVKVEDYSKATHFLVYVVPLAGFYQLAQFLRYIERDHNSCIVRGTPAPGVNLSRMLRRSRPRKGQPATLLDVPRQWVMIDVDKINCPALIDPTTNPQEAIGYVLSLLPPEFADVTCYWQFSASQGMKGNTISVHIWVFLNRPYSNAELKKYAVNINEKAGYKLIDPALFSPVQPHYTAAPIFDGIIDPLPKRSGIRQGCEDYATLNLPVDGTKNPAYKSAAAYRPGLGYQGYLARIGDDKDGFYNPIRSAIASYVATNGVDGTDVVAVKADIRHVIDNAPHGTRSTYEIERYKSDAFLDVYFEWVFEQERQKPVMPDSVTSLPTYYPYPNYPNSDKNKAAEAMKGAIVDYINSAALHVRHSRRGFSVWDDVT